MEVMKQSVIILVFLVYVNCQSLNDLDFNGDLKDLKNNLPDLENFNTSMVPGGEQVEKVLIDKCNKNGATNVVDLLKEEQNNAKVCVEAYINITVVQEELEEAKKTGSMDEVFAKYCKMWPDIHACFNNATSLAKQCMDKKEEQSFNKTLDIMNDLQEFMCLKDGDRLAMFVAEGGIECIQERSDGVQECVNKTFGDRFPNSEDLTVSNLPVLLFTEKDCTDFDLIRECINKELEHCAESTPANIVDAFLKFIKKHMPCNLVASAKTEASTSASFYTVSSTALIAVLALLAFFENSLRVFGFSVFF